MAIVAGGVSLLAQSQGTPTFRGGVDLLTVQATVIDADGRPMRELAPGDFTVTIEGRPRKVLFARFYGDEVSTASAATIVTGTPVPSAVDNTASAGGRIVVFVVDRESIQSGTEKALFDSAGSVIDALGPGDAAGAVAVPDGTVQLTRDRDVVRDTLQKFTGTMPSTGWRWTISWEEAVGIERGDKQMLAQVLYRECRPPRRPRDPGDYNPVPEGCDKTVVSQSNEMLLQGRQQARSVLAALKNLATGLAALRGPKHLVLISGGLLFDTTLLQEYTEAARAAAAVGITLDTIHVDQPATDATSMRRPVTSAFGSRELSSGLTTLAGMTGGTFFYGVGRATGVFDRIRTEIANFYELGLETVPADADGKPHEISVKVNRPNATVRARREVVLAAPAARPVTPVEALNALLQQPTDVADLRISLGSYTTRGDEASRLKLLMSARIDAPQARAPIAWGFTIALDGNVIANARQTLTTGAPWTVTTSAKLAAGTYRVRFVAVDADGRAGVLDTPVSVGLHQAGPVQTSDVIVGTVVGERLQPGSTVAQGADGVVMMELLSADPEQLARAVAVLDIIPGGSAEPVQRFRMAVQSSASTSILLAEGHFRTATLAPGRYTASVVTLVDNEPVGRVSRVFEVVGK